MDHPLKSALVFCLYRHAVAPVPHGDQSVLEDGPVTLRIDDGGQFVMDIDVGLFDLTTDVP